MTTINSISPLLSNKTISPKLSNENSVQFSDFFKNALEQVTDDLKTADTLTKQLASGDVKDLHQVMIAVEKAELGVQLTVQVRNKVVEAYQEIMRMQI